MRQVMNMERRLQDLERRMENQQRYGTVSEVKFDQTLRRWYVRMTDGENEEQFRSKWLPWSTFAHGTIKMSVPPKVGQDVVMHSPNGDSELAYAAANHNGPSAPSPHDKEDEVFFQIDDETGNPSLQVHSTKDMHKIKMGGTTVTVTNGTVTIVTTDATIQAQSATIDAPAVLIKSGSVDIGDVGGAKVARIGDKVNVKTGSSKGLWPIVEGSEIFRSK